MANGDGWYQEFLWGTVAMLFAGIYTGVIKHVKGHVTREDIKITHDDLAKVKENVQYKDNCEQIVKRLDEGNRTSHEMLVRVLDKLDKMDAAR